MTMARVPVYCKRTTGDTHRFRHRTTKPQAWQNCINAQPDALRFRL